jgi:hypothetical protein
MLNKNKWPNELNRQFSNEEAQIANRCMKTKISPHSSSQNGYGQKYKEEQMLAKRWYKRMVEKMVTIPGHKRNANQNHTKILSHSC